MNETHTYWFYGVLLLLLVLALWIWAVKDIVSNRQNKVLILLLFLAPIVGPLIYFQTKRNR